MPAAVRSRSCLASAATTPSAWTRMVRRESTRRLSESRSQSPQSVTTSAPAPVAGGQEVLVVPRQRQTRAGYGEVKSCEGSQSCSPLAVRTLPCSQVLCANQNCWFLVDDDSSCGGYCCRKCHWRHTVSPRGGKRMIGPARSSRRRRAPRERYRRRHPWLTKARTARAQLARTKKSKN